MMKLKKYEYVYYNMQSIYCEREKKMNLKDMSKEELETMGYDEIACLILEEAGKKMKLLDLFKKVCNVLHLPEETVEARIGDFFELLSINKKFIMLPKGYWDLATNHLQNIVIEDEDDSVSDELIDEEMEEDIEVEDEDEDIFYDNELDDNDDDEDDLKDLVIIDEDETIEG